MGRRLAIHAAILMNPVPHNKSKALRVLTEVTEMVSQPGFSRIQPSDELCAKTLLKIGCCAAQAGPPLGSANSAAQHPQAGSRKIEKKQLYIKAGVQRNTRMPNPCKHCQTNLHHNRSRVMRPPFVVLKAHTHLDSSCPVFQLIFLRWTSSMCQGWIMANTLTR